MASATGLVRRGRGVWMVGLMLAALAVGAAFVLQGQAVSEAQATAKRAEMAATARSHESLTQIAKASDGASLHGPLSKKVTRNIDDALHKVLAGQTAVVVRVWSPSADLRYSTLAKDASTPDRDAIRALSAGRGDPVTAVDGGVMTTYLPLGAAGAAVEVVQPDPSYQAPDPGLLGLARTVGLAVGAAMLLLIVAGLVVGRPKKAPAEDGGFAAAAPDQAPATHRGKAGATEGGGRDAAASPGGAAPEPSLRERLTRAEQARQAMEVELGQARTQLKTDNERASARVRELEGQLGTTQARLQEALVAAEAARAEAEQAAQSAAPQPEPTPVDDERIRALERELEDERMKVGAAEARVKGLEAQVRQQAEAVEVAQAAAEQSAAERAAAEQAATQAIEQTSDRTAEQPSDAADAEPITVAFAGPTEDPGRIAELEAELSAALERAREAEDRAARLQDRLVELDPAVAALESWVPPSGAGDEDGGESLRARLVRNAARRKLGEETVSGEGSQRGR